MLVSALSIALLSLATVNAAVLPITRTGKYLFDSTGARFYIKGVAYQRPTTAAAETAESIANGGFPEPNSYLDPLSDPTACARDIPNLTLLGVNTVRVYSINPLADHSVCMNAFNDAGIYVIADLALPLNGSINRAAPSWNVALLNQYISALDRLLPYPNLLSVFIGNEVVISTTNSNAAPYVKAATRDIKAYLRSKNSNVLVGYAAVDDEVTRLPLAAYLTCGSAATSLDIYGINTYQWCGSPTYAASGDQKTTTDYANLQVVGIFSEFGCVTQPRSWTEVTALFSAPMTDVWSGGIAFEYFFDEMGYGLTANTTSNDGPITTNAQFTLLAAQYAAVSPPNMTASGVAASTYAACAPPGTALLASSTLPPRPSQTYCNCLDASAFACVANTGRTPVIVGDLLNTACSLYGAGGGSCNAISGDGATGVYGSISSCSPTTTLNYVVSEYYAQQNFVATACSFRGNTSINAAAPRSAAGLQAAIASCAAGTSPSSTFVPSAPPTVSATGGSSGTAAGGASAASTAAARSSATKETVGMSFVMIGTLYGLSLLW